MKVEFIALAATSKKPEMLRNLLMEVDLWPQLVPLISMFLVSKTHNKVYNGKPR